MIFYNRTIIFEILYSFFQRGPFDVKNVKNIFLIFQKFQKKKRIPQMTFMGPLKHKKKQSQEFWVA